MTHKCDFSCNHDSTSPAMNAASPTEGCSLCGTKGIHACMGNMPDWTPEKVAEFDAALCEYESESEPAVPDDVPAYKAWLAKLHPSVTNIDPFYAFQAGRAAAPASVPEGWKHVPVEPNGAMLDLAGRRLCEQAEAAEYPETPLEFQADAHTAWDAMLAAAPVPPEVAQPAAQGESIDTPEFRALFGGLIGPDGAVWPGMVAFINAWGESQRRAGQLSMDAVVIQWGEGQRKYGRRAGIEEAAALFDTSPHAEEFRVNIAESIRALKSLATPAPTAGEPSTEPDELCNSALRAEPAIKLGAGPYVLLETEIGRIMRDWQALSNSRYELCRAVEAEALSRSRAEGGMQDATEQLKLYPASDYHENYSDVLWFAFPSFNEAPQVYCGSPLEVSPEFDDEHWTHFARVDWNDAIGQAEAMHIKATQGGKEGAG